MWLKVEHLKKSFGGVMALCDLSFTHEKGEILGIMGPNGAGKSTLFDIISGLTQPDAGNVFLNGASLSKLHPYSIARLGVTRCFQNTRLARRLTIEDNLVFSLINPPQAWPQWMFSRCDSAKVLCTERGAACVEMLRQYGIWQARSELAGNLSFGQQKLMSLVCCAARNASVMLLDEPVAGVSSILAGNIVNGLRQLRDGGLSIMVVEHDIDAIAKLCDRVLFLDRGRLICEGSLDEVRRHPKVLEAYIN